jgi:hypothetical protein
LTYPFTNSAIACFGFVSQALATLSRAPHSALVLITMVQGGNDLGPAGAESLIALLLGKSDLKELELVC